MGADAVLPVAVSAIGSILNSLRLGSGVNAAAISLGCARMAAAARGKNTAPADSSSSSVRQSAGWRTDWRMRDCVNRVAVGAGIRGVDAFLELRPRCIGVAGDALLRNSGTPDQEN
jgi:hypothetical protein